MKRRNWKTNTSDPSPNHQVRSSKTRSNSTKAADDPKTSEYAFFKKLKTDHHQSNLLFKSTDRTREGPKPNSIAKSSFKELRSSVFAKNAAPSNFDLFPSPLGAPQSSFNQSPAEENFKRFSTTFGDIHSIEKNMEEYSNTTRPGGTQYKHAEIFSRKRRKLRQWVAETSFPEIDEFCSKGYDFVSVLLSRLFPESNEDNTFRTSKSGQVESNTKSKLLASPESDIHCQKSHQMPKRNLMEVESRLYLDDDLLWLDGPRDRIHSDSDSTTVHNLETLQYNITEPDSTLGGRTTMSCIETDSAFGFSFRKYGYLPLSLFEELGDYHYTDGSLPSRKPHTLLLGWDSANMTKDRDLSISCQNTELITYPTTLTSWGNNHFLSLDNDFQAYSANGLRSLSVLSNDHPNFSSFSPSHSASYHRHKPDFGRHVFEDKEDMVADLNHLPINFSHTPSHLNLAEGSADTAGKGCSSFLSPQHHHRLIDKVFSEGHHHPAAESLLSSGLDFELGWKCLPTSHYSKELYSSTYHAPQYPQNEGVSSQLLNGDKYESCLYGSVGD